MLGIALAALGWALVLLLTGGTEFEVFGQSVRSNDPKRPLLIGSFALSLFLLLDGWAGASCRLGAVVNRAWAWIAALLRSAAALWRSVRSPSNRATNVLLGWPGAVAIAAVVTGVALTYGSRIAGGSDSYGYVSEAELWMAGDLVVEQPWVEEVPWELRRWTFVPLGYRPAPDGFAIVPVYSPGLPILMAAASLAAGPCAMFWVVPLCAGVLVLASYGIGRDLTGRPAAGLVTAWLVATSPITTAMSLNPMSDIPVSAAWAVSFFLLFRPIFWGAAGAGLAAGAAVLIRPNLIALGGVSLVWLAWSAVRHVGPDRRRAWLRLAGFLVGCAPGVAATMAIFAHLYGSPFQSGYGDLSQEFSLANVPANIVLYGRWLLEVHTPFALVGLAALAVPWCWPGMPHRSRVVCAAAAVAVLWTSYLSYSQFENWYYLRFLLPSWPFMMAGMAQVLTVPAIARRPWPAFGALVIVLALGVLGLRFDGRHAILDTGRLEHRYVEIARLVADRTESNAVVLSIQHSGALRHYGGRITASFGSIGRTNLDEAVAWLSARGVPVYLLVDDWEVPRFRDLFDGEALVGVVDRPPLLTYFGPGVTTLYALSSREPSSGYVVLARLPATLTCIRSVPLSALVLGPS